MTTSTEELRKQSDALIAAASQEERRAWEQAERQRLAVIEASREAFRRDNEARLAQALAQRESQLAAPPFTPIALPIWAQGISEVHCPYCAGRLGWPSWPPYGGEGRLAIPDTARCRGCQSLFTVVLKDDKWQLGQDYRLD